MRIDVGIKPIEMPTREITSKINIAIDVSQLLEELQRFDARITIELAIMSANDTYYYSFIKRNIMEETIIFPMFVAGEITNLDDINYTVQISYISKL